MSTFLLYSAMTPVTEGERGVSTPRLNYLPSR